MNAKDAERSTKESYNNLCIEKKIKIIDDMISNEIKRCSYTLFIHDVMDLFSPCQLRKIINYYRGEGFYVSVDYYVLMINWEHPQIKENNNV